MATNTDHKIEKGEILQVLCAIASVVLILFIWTSLK